MCPESLDLSEYTNIMGESVDTLFADRFDEKYFTGTASYSQLCVSNEFYEQFADYEYMMIYQTDCWIFEDKIMEWCDKGYDYIGAPILTNYFVWSTTPTVGNGGLSLRKVSKFIEMTDPEGELLKKYGDVLKPESVTIEDKYFCEDVYNIYDFNKARVKTAASFAWDMNPENLYEMNGMNLPMGLHAWTKNVYFLATLVEAFDIDELYAECDEWEKNETLYVYMIQHKEAYPRKNTL